MKKVVLLIMLFTIGVSYIWGQTSLSPGDLMLVTGNADGDDNFDFVPLVDIESSTEIYFTDNAWDGSDLLSNEGTLKYTSSSAVSAGTVVSYSGSIGGEWSSVQGSFNIAASGDEILVYQGSSGSPSFVLGVGWARTEPWISEGTVTTNTSYIPSSLSEGAKTIASWGTSDNYQYNTSNGTSGSKTELLAKAADGSNFNSNDANAYTALSATFTITGGGSLSLSNISRAYVVPTNAQTCYVQCDITGGSTPYTALVKYSADGVSQGDISMSNTGGDTYRGTIPVQSNGTRVEYYIDVTDAAKANVNSSTYGLFWGTSDISNSSGDIKSVDGNGALEYENYYARITGVATVASGVFSTFNLDVYIQDDAGGINLYKGGASSTTITKGNSYTVVGIIDQYNGKAEIIPDDAGSDITNNGAGTLPSPTITTISNLLSNPEYYEGRLIGIQHCSLQSGTWPSSTSFVTVTMTDDGGSNTLDLRINNVTAPTPEPSWAKDIVGIGSQYDASSPYTTGYQWFSRSSDDYYADGTLPVTLSTFTAQYLNSKPTLYWQTQSEEDNMGWFIYRNTVEDFTSAEKISGMLPGHGTTTQPQDYIYEDAEQLQVEQTYYYWLESVDYSGTIHHFDMVANVTIPHTNDPGQNITPPVAYEITADPNPFSYTTDISFVMDQPSLVDVAIYNVKGQLVKSFNSAMTTQENETVSFSWNGKSDAGKTLSNGVYLYLVKVNGQDFATKQLILMK